MTRPINGLHHVTAIASDPQKNLDFYAGALGLRLVKKTVNFDDPSAYHFYFGNELGEPGTLLTFFPWPDARRGTAGSGQTRTTAFSVPEGSLGFWQERLRSLGVDCAPAAPGPGAAHEALRLRDPDDLQIELVADADAARTNGSGQLPDDVSIRSLHGVTLAEDDLEATARFLEETLGFRHVGDLEGGVRYATGDERARVLDVVVARGGRGRIAAGSVHHIAWRVPDDPTELAWRQDLVESGVAVTPVKDRNYFNSIYFREPGGVLFEIATDVPGFTIDEPASELGGALKLPPQYESHRAAIEAALPAVAIPSAEALAEPQS